MSASALASAPAPAPTPACVHGSTRSNLRPSLHLRLRPRTASSQGYVNRRFHESVTNKPEFAEYMYQHWQGQASGELALQAMLSPGAFAKRPLIDRIPQLDPKIPITVRSNQRL